MITAKGVPLTVTQIRHIFAPYSGILSIGYHPDSPYNVTTIEMKKFYGGTSVLDIGPQSAGLRGETAYVAFSPQQKGKGMFVSDGVDTENGVKLYVRLYSPIFAIRRDAAIGSVGKKGWLGTHIEGGNGLGIELQIREVEDLINYLTSLVTTIRGKGLTSPRMWPAMEPVVGKSAQPVDYLSPSERMEWEQMTRLLDKVKYLRGSDQMSKEFELRMEAQKKIFEELDERMQKMKEGSYKHGIKADWKWPNIWIDHLNMQLEELERVARDLTAYINNQSVRITPKQSVSMAGGEVAPEELRITTPTERVEVVKPSEEIEAGEPEIVRVPVKSKSTQEQQTLDDVIDALIERKAAASDEANMWDQGIGNLMGKFRENFEKLKQLYRVVLPKVEKIEEEKIVEMKKPETIEESPEMVALPIAAHVNIENRLIKVADTLESRGMRNVSKTIENILEFFKEVHKTNG